MNDLKTLKEVWKMEDGKSRMANLKAEAIKWVKEIKGFGNKYPLRFSTNFIKHFFNLTSEDLFKENYNQAIEKGEPIIK